MIMYVSETSGGLEHVPSLHLPVAANDSQHPTAGRPRGSEGSIGDGHEDALPDAPDHGHCTSNGEPL